MKTRTAGLLAACGIAAASIVIITIFAMRGGPARTARGAASSNIAPPDITSLPTTPTGGPDADSLMGGSGLFVQVMDRRDPTRISSEIVSKSLEPLEAKNYRVELPRAWLYLRDGRVVHIQSRHGRLHMPDRTREPDSGTLEGEVDIRMFAPPAPGARIDLAKDTPIIRARTETLQFDGSLGEVSTPDPIRITSARTDFDGRGLRLLINEAQERIELLRVESDGVLRHRPKESAPARSEPPPAETTPPRAETSAAEPGPAPEPAAETHSPSPATTPADPAAASEAPRETFYHAVFDGPVKVNQAALSISDAQKLELWVHLIDNELPPGAIAEPRTTRAETPAERPTTPTGAADKPDTPAAQPGVPNSLATPPAPMPTEAPAAPPAAAEPAPGGLISSSDEEVVMTWPGAMEIRPLEARPPELAGDDVALRFTAGPGRPVMARDDQSDSTVTARTIGYSATRRAVELESDRYASLMRPGQGELRAPRIGIDTAAGIVDIPTRGELIAAQRADDADDRPRSVAWADNAQFQFEVVDDSMTELLRRAAMVGQVHASDGDAILTGETLQAWFTPDSAGRAAISRLLVRENAIARDAHDGRLEAGSLDVSFAPTSPGEDPTPRTVAASGRVHAERDGSTIDADSLDARLARDADGEITVTTVDARDDVRFARADGVRAGADELHADAERQIVDLAGQDAFVGKDADNVYGGQIRLDGLARTLEVFGPGRFEHLSFDPAGLPVARADAAWTKGMTFDDRAGVLNAAGQVVAVNQPDPLTVETLRADRVKLLLTPLDESEAAEIELATAARPDKPDEPGRPETPREVLSAEALGSDLEREDGVRAAAELRRYESARAREEAAAPQQLQYLESSRIIADNQAGTLHTPGPGKLLVVDRRRPAEAPRPAAEAGPAEPPDVSRGDALFTWQASMTMSRADGTCRMEKGVKMAHSDLADDELTELECESLTARIREEPGESAPAVDLSGATRDLSGRLVEADAIGAVYIRSQGKELLADGVKYHAEARTVEAWANEDNIVTLFDPANPTPLTARRLFWDLASDRIEVREAGTIVAPR